MTFKSFTTVDELFNMLTARFEIEPPAGMNAEEHNDWTVRMQAPIRIRCVPLSRVEDVC
jgi:son of sevenless